MNDDSTTLKIIRNFLASDKPASISPVDILQMVHFMTCKVEDHDAFHSQQTLARMFHTDARTIARSQQRLASPEIDWIARPQRRGKTNAISIKYQSVPGEEIIRLKISADAGKLSLRYQTGLRKHGRKKFPAQWFKQQLPSAQRVLDQCNGDIELAAKLIGHALSHPQHCKKAMQSLYHVYGRWPKILETYSARLQEIESYRKQAEQTAQMEVVTA